MICFGYAGWVHEAWVHQQTQTTDWDVYGDLHGFRTGVASNLENLFCNAAQFLVQIVARVIQINFIAAV